MRSAQGWWRAPQRSHAKATRFSCARHCGRPLQSRPPLDAASSGALLRAGAFQWVDSWDPAGRGLRWRGELPGLAPTPWAFAPERLPPLVVGQIRQDLPRTMPERAEFGEEGAGPLTPALERVLSAIAAGEERRRRKRLHSATASCDSRTPCRRARMARPSHVTLTF